MCNVDTSIPFENVNAQIRKKKRVHLMKYVAGVAAVLMVGMVFVFFMEEEKNEPVRQVLLSSVSKGKTESFATLVTTSGKVVYLEDSVKQESLKERNKETLKPIENESDPQVIPTQEVEYNVLTTSKQGNIKIVLYDGSLVWLNAGSELRYPNTFVENQRVVYLKGEAYFDVTKKKKTPFIVRTDKYDIEVLGTQFDVDAYPDQTAFETTLMKGSVKVTSQHFPEQTITLKPHHKAYVKDGQLAVTKVNDFTPYRWKEGLICFKDEPFQTIMEDFEKYYGIRIIINNKKVLKYSYNGKFRQADGIDYALRVLQRDIHFKYEKANDEEIIYIN